MTDQVFWLLVVICFVVVVLVSCIACYLWATHPVVRLSKYGAELKRMGGFDKPVRATITDISSNEDRILLLKAFLLLLGLLGFIEGSNFRLDFLRPIGRINADIPPSYVLRVEWIDPVTQKSLTVKCHPIHTCPCKKGDTVFVYINRAGTEVYVDDPPRKAEQLSVMDHST